LAGIREIAVDQARGVRDAGYHMEQIVTALGVGVPVFASTNVDDILLLSAFFSDPSFTNHQVVIGQLLGIGVLVVVSAACAFLSLAVPEGWIGLLGLAPLALGLRGLWALWRDRRTTPAETLPGERPPSATYFTALAVAGVTVANGGDNLGVYIPLFAKNLSLVPVYAAIFAVMTVIWCVLGHALVNNPLIGGRIRHYGRMALPFVLIGLGLWIWSSALVLLRPGSVGHS
jgi:cadmium resistance protein CadD (predicted permease)